jgi:hypothetical protein
MEKSPNKELFIQKVFCLTCVSLQVCKVKFCRTLMTPSLMFMRVNLIPMQFLGPFPKGMYLYGSMLSLFFLLNLVSQLGKQSHPWNMKTTWSTCLVVIS